MKKLIKYRICAMLILIVLMFSWVPVNAKITDPPSNVEGDGTAENPYVIDIGAVGGRIVLKPDAVPFNFIVKGTGGIGGLFTVDYDVSNGLVAFTLTETVDILSGDTRTNATVAREKGASSAQLGITSMETTETLSPKYEIYQLEKYWTKNSLSFYLKNKGIKLTNANAQITTGINLAKDDLYFFANDPQFFSLDLAKYKNSDKKNDRYAVIKAIDDDLGTSTLSDFVKMIEVSGYEFTGIDFGNKLLKFSKLNEKRRTYNQLHEFLF